MSKAFWKPSVKALSISSKETFFVKISFIEVILFFATFATSMHVFAHGTRKKVNIFSRSTSNKSVPCWRTMPLLWDWALPEIFLPLTVRFGHAFALPSLKSAFMPKISRASAIPA